MDAEIFQFLKELREHNFRERLGPKRRRYERLRAAFPAARRPPYD